MNGVALQTLEIERVARATDRWGERLLGRLFSDAERAYCDGKRKAPQHHAARLAAKLATRRVLGAGVRLIDIEVERDDDGAPHLRLSGSAAERLAGARLLLSLSHDDGLAVALVVRAEGEA